MTTKKLLAVGAVVTAVAAGCGSSKPTSVNPSGTTKGAGSYTVGILTDITGPAASGNKTCVQGVKAGAVAAAKQGYTINYVVGDTQTSPAAALSAAQSMIQQSHVLTVIACSALTFGAADYMLQQSVPVIGAAEDGPEWAVDKNMFSVSGALDNGAVSTAYGQFFKMEGATVIGALGYSISPSSADAAKAAAASSKADGLTVGYLNASFPFGSTNVAPEALAMKAAGVNGFTSTTDPNTSFALLTALRNAGDNPKVALFPDGYGGDLVASGPGATQAAQGAYFTTVFEPVEMHTAATVRFQSALTKAGVAGDPTYAEYNGYTAIAMLVDALKAAGSSATRATLTTALDGLQGFNADGLLGTHSFAPADRTGSPIGVGGCGYYTKFSGSTFHLVANADPLCGTVIPGVRVAP